MTDQTKQKLKYWLLGIFTGGATAAPITAFVMKKVYDKKIAKAEEIAENRGMNAMAEYVVNQQNAETMAQGSETMAHETLSQASEPMSQDEDGIPTAEEINNWDVSIDDEEATEEARERTNEHEQYLNMIHNYNYEGNRDMMPYVIDSEKFINEQYMEKSYVNWYEDDNVFEEDLNVIDDPYMSLGVTDGHELFRNSDLREDPDICYIRNERVTTDFEITRIHGAYSKMSGDEQSIGEAD